MISENSNEQATPASTESVAWIAMSGKIKGFTCMVNGRDWGGIMKARKIDLGDGWCSTLSGGFCKSLEDAQEAHLDAVNARRSALAEPQEPKAFIPRVEGMSAEDYCRSRGKPYINRNLLRLKRMEEQSTTSRSRYQ